MKNKSYPTRQFTYVIALVSGFAAAAILNVTSLQYEPIQLWVRVICPVLIFVGIIGSVREARFIRIFGWLGIGLFIVCGLQMILPGDDYMSGGPNGPPLEMPRLVSPYEIGIRLVAFLIVVAGLIYGFRRLKAAKPKDE